MSTNEELIDEVRAYPPVSEWDEPGEADEVMRRLADALEQTTRELSEAWRVTAEQTRQERGRAEQAEAKIAKVREVYQAWCDHTAANPTSNEEEAIDLLLSDISDALDESASRPAPTEPSELIRCDYCGDALPSLVSRGAGLPGPSLVRLGFAADKVVCPECAAAPAPTEGENRG